MRSLFSLVEWLCFVPLVNGSLSPGSHLDSSGTSSDVVTLFSIVAEFGFPPVFTESWRGNDPCQNWYGIACRKEGSIRSINFMYVNLTGIISPKFADLTSLLTIDLSHNRLTGTIPVELLTKLKLKVLDVSFNDLHGKVPPFNKEVINVEGNPQIEIDDVSSQTRNKKKSTTLGLFIGIGVGLLLAGIVGGIGFYFLMRRRRSNMPTEQNERVARQVQQDNADGNVIPIQILRDATGDFGESNVIGRGGFGIVYKGTLPDGTEVAVKRMYQSSHSGRGVAQFKSEVSVLTKVHHRNLVVLYGHCLHGNDRMLVYEYMQQDTLSRHLHHWKDHGLKPLEWSRRLTIALDVARGLEYLHTLARQSQSYVHRDLKPSNILLGNDLRAKVSDLGLVRSTAEGKESFRTHYGGTTGYIAPEFTMTGRVTRKVDVYSFGVILMELITGLKAVDQKRSEDCPHIAIWFRNMLLDQDSLAKVIDETIEVTDETRGSIHEVAKLAIHCCAKQAEQRPDMTYAVLVLTSLTEQWKPSEVEESTDLFHSELAKRWQERELGESSNNITVV